MASQRARQIDRGTSRRFSLITLDQAVSGASNIVVAILAARMLGPQAFGLFGIVFLAFVLVQGLVRALVLDPALVHPDEVDESPGRVIASATQLALVLAIAVLLVAAIILPWNDELAASLALVGIACPLVSCQDAGRYLGFGLRRPGLALALDTMWLVLLCLTVAILARSGEARLPCFVGAWLGSGAVAGLLTLWVWRSDRQLPNWIWLRQVWPISWRYAASFSAVNGCVVAASALLGVIAGASALGGVRGALLLLRPFMTVQIAVIAFGSAEVSRMGHGRAPVRRHVGRITALASGAALVNGIVVLVVPDSLGRVLLGETWEVTEPLLLAAAVQALVLALAGGVRAGMLGIRAAREVMWFDLAIVPLLLVFSVLGAALWGAEGYMWGVVASWSVVVPLWWLRLDVNLGRESNGAREDPAPTTRTAGR